MPPVLTRGQWTLYGTGDHKTATFRSLGRAGIDIIQTGELIPAGQTVGHFLGGSATDETAFWSWAGHAWDTTRNQFVVMLYGGHGGTDNFDVNVFDMPTGTWNPTTGPNALPAGPDGTGRPLNPYSGVLQKVGVSCLPQFFIGGAPDIPQAFIDVNNQYASVADVCDFFGPTLINKRLLPSSGHNHGGIVYMPSVDRFFVCVQADHWNQGATQGIWEWDPVTRKFSADFTGNDFNPTVPDNQGISTNKQGADHAVWDSLHNRVLCQSRQNFFAYDPAQPKGSRVIRLRGLGTTDTAYATNIFDPKRNRVVSFRVFFRDDYVPIRPSPSQGYWDFTTGVNTPTLVPFTLTGQVPPKNGGTGSPEWAGGGISGAGGLYDPVSDRYIIWGGDLEFVGEPRVLYSIHPDTFVSTKISPSGPSPGYPGAQGPPNGGIPMLWNSFAYLPTYDAYAELSFAYDNAAWNKTGQAGIYAPLRLASPVLACTDILSGPRTGNSDTAFGQVAGQDGAYVTVYGFNFGNPEDMLTATLGGVTMRVIDRGQATGARSPATLYNQYMKLQMAVLQVPAAAPLGASILAVTVNGQAAISPDLTFTVLPGTIRFVASAGALQSTFDAMGDGDVTYVRDNVSWTTLFLRSNTQNPTGQLALVAYPGAAVVLGNSSWDGIVIDASGGGANCTFAKLNIRGSNGDGTQAVSVRDGGRIVGCNIQVPGGHGKSGSVGMFGSNLAVLANEFTNCGSGPPADDQYHVVYRSGRRGVPEAARFVESGFRGAYNYFHGNNAARAFNLYNDEVSNNPIAEHELDHNVIVDQQWAGIGFLGGVVGTNSAHDNLLIRCGLATGGGQGMGVQVQAGYPFDWIKARSPITITFEHNTFFNCGDAAGNPAGAFYIDRWANYSLVFRNNLTQQVNGLPYTVTVPSGPLGPDATKRSHNLWFGAGAPPAFDSGALNVDPLLVSVTAPLDLHLQATSQARAAGLVLGAGSFDLDGKQRPATAPDLGAYQFAAGTIITPPPTPTASLALVFNGLLVDRVGQTQTALAPDGANDGVVTVTLTTSDGTPKTITALLMLCHDPAAALIGQWDTSPSPEGYILAAALTPTGPLLNNATTMGVNFTVASGGVFVVIGSEIPLSYGYQEFTPGNTLTVTATCADGTTATGSVVIGAGPPPPTLASLNPSTGPAGVQVTLLGNNFSGIPGGNTVRFGSTPATIISEGVSAIVVLAPPLPDATYLVTVTTADGTSNGLPFQEVTLVGAGHGYPAVRTRFRRWS